jgi:serine/threonine-protein kinase
MAEIYRATDTELGRDVAVKVLSGDCAEDGTVRARFLREARAAARLSGEPHTVSLYDVGEYADRPFLVMEYLPGGSLADRIRRRTVPPEQAFVWLDQAARALDRAHAHGVVHRDVKPANLLLDASGNLHVADFGIARAEGLESHTQTGTVLGTAGYLAPEQARGLEATPASDRYALAVVAYELLTGSRPGLEPSSALPQPARAVFTRALDASPESRFASCVAFVSALRTAFDPSAAPTAVLLRRRRRAPTVAAAVLALGGLGALAALAVGSGSTDQPDKPPPSQHVVRTVGPVSPARTQQPSVQTPSPPVQAVSRDEGKDHPGRGHGRGHGKGHEKEKKAKKD